MGKKLTEKAVLRIKQLLGELIADAEQSLPVNLSHEDSGRGKQLEIPLSCRFDKSFYAAYYYARKFPIVKKRLSTGKSTILLHVAVSSDNTDLLMFLFYCIVPQSEYAYYIYSEEMHNLEKYLEKKHPVMRLKKNLELIEKDYAMEDLEQRIVEFSKAKNIVKEYYRQFGMIRDKAYSEMVKNKKIHGKWSNEYRLFSLVSILFDDAVFQYKSEWLGQQTLDIFVPSVGIAIEYQGKQHYESIKHFGGESCFEMRQKLDSIKKKKCSDQKIQLLYWPYEWKINMSTLCTLLRGSVQETYLDEERINFRVSECRIEKLIEWG